MTDKCGRAGRYFRLGSLAILAAPTVHAGGAALTAIDAASGTIAKLVSGVKPVRQEWNPGHTPFAFAGTLRGEFAYVTVPGGVMRVSVAINTATNTAGALF